MNTVIGYLMPEFPGQTHTFWWREIKSLEELGLKVDILSTRYPLLKLASHAWVSEAIARTHFLFPLKPKVLFWSGVELLRSGPVGWGRCLKSIVQADDVGLKDRLRLLALVLVGAQVSWLARQRQWQHLHVHSCADGANIALFARLLSGLPYSLTLHGPQLSNYGPNQKQKWTYASLAIVVSQALYTEVRQSLSDISLPPLKVAPMGVEVKTFRRQQPYQPWMPGETCRIFSCGRLNAVKGHDDLIRAVALLRDAGVDVSLKVAGGTDPSNQSYQNELAGLIRELQLDNQVELLGSVSEDTIRQGLEASHLFALHSHREGIPVAVMEAMALQLPVIVSDIEGNRELIENSVDGILVEPGNPGQMAEAVQKVLRSPQLATQLGQTARQKIERDFNSDVSAQLLMDYLSLNPALR